MRPIRVFTVVGGGSAYTPGLLAALLHHAKRLPLAEVRLHDVDERHLDVVHALGAKMALAAGAPFRVTATTDLRDAVTDTDCVLNSARPGGFECRRLDETLPLDFGIPGQETVGPGGFFFALRSVPQALALAEAIAMRSPSAVLLNYTNPTNIVTQALADRTPVRTIGMCDQSDGDLEDLGLALGEDRGPDAFTCVGLNHATWYADLVYSGRRFTGLLPDAEVPASITGEHRRRFEVSRAMAAANPGFWPNSYLPYYVAPAAFVASQREEGPRTDAIVRLLDGYFAHFREEAERDVPRLTRHRGGHGFGDMAVRVLIALGSETPVPLVLNVQNHGLSSRFDAGTVVEARVLLSRHAMERPPAPEPPQSARTLLSRLETYQRRTAEAAAIGDAGAAARALVENPLVPDRATAEALMSRARIAYGARIPAFCAGRGG